MPGWWRNSSDVNNLLDFHRCLSVEHCPGGDLCGNNRDNSSVLCSHCVNGWSSSDAFSECQICPEEETTSWTYSALVALIACLMVALCYWVILRMDHSPMKAIKQLDAKYLEDLSAWFQRKHVFVEGTSRRRRDLSQRQATAFEKNGKSSPRQRKHMLKTDDSKR
jgi:hypothetical protein